MSLVHRIKYQFSEPYRIRTGRGLSAVRSGKELKALISFCREQLEDKKHMKLNPDRRKIYGATLKLFELKTPNGFIFTFDPKVRKGQYYNDVWHFIEDHVGWYWG